MNLIRICSIYAVGIIVGALIGRWLFENYFYHPPIDISSKEMMGKITEGERLVGGIVVMFLGGVLGIVVVLLGRILLSLRHKKS